MRRIRRLALAAGVAGLACTTPVPPPDALAPSERAAAATFAWRLPPGFPLPAVPAGEEMSTARVELGRHLFYDRRLSATGDFACAACHRQELAFTDGRPRALGATAELHPRHRSPLRRPVQAKERQLPASPL